MAFVLRHQSTRATRGDHAPRLSSVCRVHSCRRCSTAIDTSAPCSFVPSMGHICPACAGQEQVLAHTPAARTPWGAALARASRA